MNAFWDGDEMTFGDGGIFTSFAQSLDVIVKSARILANTNVVPLGTPQTVRIALEERA